MLGQARAHPRVGGENLVASRFRHVHDGSSPRGRGKLVEDEHRRVALGLIPAWAGKTTTGLASGLIWAAHPRVGGENRAARARSRRTSGSSPRGRGKLIRVDTQLLHVRLIPAWAGKTRC